MALLWFIIQHVELKNLKEAFMKIQPMLNERGPFSQRFNVKKYENKTSWQEYQDRKTAVTVSAIIFPILIGTLIGFISTDFFIIGAGIGFFIGVLITFFLLIVINLDNIDQAEHNGFEEEAENQRAQLKAGIAASVVAGIKIADSMKDGIKDIADVDHWKN